MKSWIGPVVIGFICFIVSFIVARRARLRERELRRQRRPCAHCGYSLIGNVSGVCPECGTAVASAES